MQPDAADLGYLWDMLDFAREARRSATSRSYQELLDDRDFYRSMLYLIQTIGEAATHVSRSFVEAHGEIPWRDAIGIRHVIVHGYRVVEPEEIWTVLQRDLPLLVIGLDALLSGNARPGV
jgi:uncharacterized protein with HEPN domain